MSVLEKLLIFAVLAFIVAPVACILVLAAWTSRRKQDVKTLPPT